MILSGVLLKRTSNFLNAHEITDKSIKFIINYVVVPLISITNFSSSIIPFIKILPNYHDTFSTLSPGMKSVKGGGAE